MFTDIEQVKNLYKWTPNKMMTYEIFAMKKKKKTIEENPHIIRIEHNRIGSSDRQI